MSAALELVWRIEAAGGRFAVEGEELVIRPGDPAMPLVAELRLHKAEIIDLIRSRTATPPTASEAMSSDPQDDDPDEWAADFVAWVDANCVHRPGKDDWTAVSTLHIAFCESQIARDSVPCTRNAFESLLRQLGCRFSNGMVSGFLLKTDLEAVLCFQAGPAQQAEPSPKRSTRRSAQ
jgi:hypothetical protein